MLICHIKPKMNLNKAALSFVASSNIIRFASSLSVTTNIKLHNPWLLRISDTDEKSSKTSSGHLLEVLNPAASSDEVEDGSAVIAFLPSKSRHDAVTAIETSATAFKKWSTKTTGMQRSKMLIKWAELIKESEEDIAKIMTLESGKPLAESRGEINYGVSFLEYYAGEAIRPTNAGGGTIWPTPFSLVDGTPRAKVMAIQEPIGVTAHITPWNFPMAMITRKAGPALAAGCSVVLKPSELTPLTAIALHHLAVRAGIPKDVFQLIITDTESTPEVGEEFCTNPLVKKISFTGSTRVGKLLMKMSSDTVKRVSLELGGNAAFIVFDDANIDQAVKAAITSKFRNAGQTCVCADRFIIHESVEEEFINQFKEKVAMMKVGSGMLPDSAMGPLISATGAQHVKEKVDEVIADGAECILGGSLMSELGPNFYQPTILRNVKTTSKLWSTETFGPVAAITTFHSEDEAVELANDTRSGLASYFITNDMARVFRVAERLENGIVGINEGIISTALAPFGGVKESGLGREGSSAGLAEFLETKYILLNH
mmetsp:Transcript_33027/g.38460  ORF Transcript_33027/g.38460 Transcript_33027/m.38460 type:complete len:542 (-) Transcript_33027:126-1751(-)